MMSTRHPSWLLTPQSTDYTYDIMSKQLNAKTQIRIARSDCLEALAEQVKSELPEQTRRAMDLASEQGASSWLTALPVEEFGFSLHKGAFFDALALRYGWLPPRLPSHCTCGEVFTVEHSLSCKRGGFPIIRHNEIRDITANLLSEVCHSVKIKPDLQPQLERCCLLPVLTQMMVHAWTLLPVDFGVAATKEHFWTSVCLIHMLRQTAGLRFPPVIENTKGRRRECMSSESGRQSMPVSPLWSCPQPVA